MWSTQTLVAREQIRQCEAEAEEKNASERKPHVGEVEAKFLRPEAPRGDWIVATERDCTFAIAGPHERVVDAACVADIPGTGDDERRSCGEYDVAQPGAKICRPHEELRPNGECQARRVRDGHRPGEQHEGDEKAERSGPAGALEPVRPNKSPQRRGKARSRRQGEVKESRVIGNGRDRSHSERSYHRPGIGDQLTSKRERG